MTLNPTHRSLALERQILSREWFYKFTLPSGATTHTYIPDEVLQIHTTRLEMMFSVLDPFFDATWPNATCIDLSSHQGFFAYHLAQKAKYVLGLDFQSEHIESANLIREVYSLKNCEFRQADIGALDADDIEPADVVTMFGLLYNLEDPIGGLRKARRMTKRILLVETQTTILDLTGKIDSGLHYGVMRCMAYSEYSRDFPDLTEPPQTLFSIPAPKASYGS